MKKTHKHLWTSSDMKYYHLKGTRLWLFRKCLKCSKIQDAIVDTDAFIRWRPYEIHVPKPRPKPHTI